jgi:type VI secretion system secreted protein VgrG
MEHEGIHYFFEHATASHKLIIADSNEAHATLGSGEVLFRSAWGSTVSGGRTLSSFRCRKQGRSSQVRVADYDPSKPAVDLDAAADALKAGFGVRVDHAVRAFDPATSKRLATVRAEELLAEQAVFDGRGDVIDIRPGYRFEVGEHPIAWMNANYLAVEVSRRGNVAPTPELARYVELPETTGVETVVHAIAAETLFRPPRRTAKPRIHGVETALVDGESDSEYAQLDEQGRYLVRFHFDESDLGAGKASTRLRMMQPHAGSPEGWHVPLRKGTEVLIAFLGGDPDRPIVLGAVPNAHTPSPVTSSNNTCNVIGLGAESRLSVQDEAGGQWIDLTTPFDATGVHLGLPHNPSHNFVITTAGNALFDFGTDQDIYIGSLLEETVTGAVKETYTAEQDSDIKGPKKTKVTGGVTETYQGSQLTTVAAQVTETYNDGQDTTVQAAPRTEFFLGSQKTAVSGKPVQQQLDCPHTRVVNGSTIHSHATLERHVTGPVSMVYPAGVTRLWGPTTGEFKSLQLVVPGGTSVVTGKWDVSVPADRWSFFSYNWTTSLKIEIGPVKFARAALKMERTGLSLGASAERLEVWGASISLRGLYCDASGKDFQKAPTGFEAAALIVYI